MIPFHYTLTGWTPVISCYGTSFPSLEAAKARAIYLQQFGLCLSFGIGCYKDGKHIEVYTSKEEDE